MYSKAKRYTKTLYINERPKPQLLSTIVFHLGVVVGDDELVVLEILAVLVPALGRRDGEKYVHGVEKSYPIFFRQLPNFTPSFCV